MIIPVGYISDETLLQQAVQTHLDQVAQAHGYDNIVSACSYAAASNPFQSESQAFLIWRGNVWQYCYSVLAQVEAGTLAKPTIDELLAQLPVYGA